MPVEFIKATKKGRNNDSAPFRAGQLALFHTQWKEMGAPEVALKLIQGYRIPFFAKPPLVYPNVNTGPFHTPASKEMSAVVQKMKAQGVLKVAQLSPSFISPLFLVPKSDGSARPIFNLKALNDYVMTEPFHLINMHRIPDFLQPNDWMCKVDISQAYFHVKVAEAHRRFLRLIYNRELLEMTCLPFGLSTAPKTFSILTNWVAQTLRQQWNIRILVYLDDYLIVHQNARILEDHVNITVQTLQRLGWKVNFEKSILHPQKSIVYLGILWRTWDNLKSLPKDKVMLLSKNLKQVLAGGKLTLKSTQRTVGSLNFASFVVPRGRLNHRRLLMFLNTLPNPSTKAFPIPQHVSNELSWWIQNCQASTPLHYPPPTDFLTTDASDLAWGAQLNDLGLSGSWSREEQNLHCNQKEMLAILYALQGHAQLLCRSSILIQCDNRTAVAHLRIEGGSKSLALVNITHQILDLLDRHQIHFSIHYLPGKFNCHADNLSRHRHPPEWHLLPASLEIVFAKWGTPVIDLFASATAHVVHNYVSRDLRDQQALYHDAFSKWWNYPLAWVFPPPFLVPRVLSHLNQSTGIFLIVVPRWEKVFWRADLKARALAAPVTLRNLPKNLVDTSTGQPPPKVENIILEVWKCGGGLKR
jgi:hypothetical protein